MLYTPAFQFPEQTADASMRLAVRIIGQASCQERAIHIFRIGVLIAGIPIFFKGERMQNTQKARSSFPDRASNTTFSAPDGLGDLSSP
jgi:hypothetical protein